MHPFFNWQINYKLRTSQSTAANGDRTAVVGHDALGNAQTNTRSVRTGCKKGIKNLFFHSLGNAGPGIGHTHKQLALAGVGSHPDSFFTFILLIDS